MTTIEDLRESIDDDSPRLAFADELERQGDGERAEFIRTQCRRHSLKEEHDEVERLLDREAELLVRNHEAWCEPLSTCGDLSSGAKFVEIQSKSSLAASRGSVHLI